MLQFNVTNMKPGNATIEGSNIGYLYFGGHEETRAVWRGILGKTISHQCVFHAIIFSVAFSPSLPLFRDDFNAVWCS